MKRIEAIIRKTKFEDVKEALLRHRTEPTGEDIPWRPVLDGRDRARGSDHRMSRSAGSTYGQGYSRSGAYR